MCDLVFANPDLENCRKLVEHDLEHCREDLAPLQSGEVRVGECVPSGPWHDITPAMISFLERNIATLETLLRVLQPRKLTNSPTP
jgi:hypothetical protein